MSTTTRTAQDIRNDIAKLEGELATLAGEGLEVWHGTYGDLRDCPPGGATLTVEWAVSDQSYQTWYPTTESAKAALLALARREGTVPDDNGWHVDLTAPGCHTSRAYVTRIES